MAASGRVEFLLEQGHCYAESGSMVHDPRKRLRRPDHGGRGRVPRLLPGMHGLLPPR